MTAERSICKGICICQMTAILSGVALVYLTKLAIVPASNELSMNFERTPIMCTTVDAKDIIGASKGPQKPLCDWTTCGEWCLSKGNYCMQIHVMVRKNGSRVSFKDCVDIDDENCSALNINQTHVRRCKKGQCKDLTGTFNCTRDDNNACTDISPAFVCHSRDMDKTSITCTEKKCGKRLEGVYTCTAGICQKLNEIKKYWEDCERKCTDLEMRERNVVIFSKERLVATACSDMDSLDYNSTAAQNIAEVSSSQEWQDKRNALFIFCTYVDIKKGEKTYDIISRDCFNATLIDANKFRNIKEYMKLQVLHQSFGGDSNDEWIIAPESSLRIMNNTQLRINPEGCVNTLSKECTKFIDTHAHDGFDGMTQDRYPCYITNQSQEYVIGKFNPERSLTILLVASLLPGCLFVIACTCLFVCSKSIGVDDDGHLRVTLLQGGGAGGNASEL